MYEKEECNCGVKEELEKIKRERENDCQAKLHECRKASREKDRELESIKKKQNILLILIVVIATILGKETIDSVASWIDSLNNIKSGVEQFTSQAEPDDQYEYQFHSGGGIVPAPGAIALLMMAGFAGIRRRRN